MSIPQTIKIKSGELPAKSGVYLFKDKKGKVVYVGKATNLKSRVGSYFRDLGRSDLRFKRRSDLGISGRPIDEMLYEVRRIDYQVTDSVIEALILEANLIKKYQPRYNVRDKDDKSFLYVVVMKEKWPKVVLMRGQELHNPPQPSLTLREGDRSFLPLRVRGSESGLRVGVMKVFGPYTSASAIRAALDLIRKWFPWSTCQGNMGTRKHGNKRACFDYHIGRCPGVCIGAITRREYMKNIRNVILFLDGKKSRVLKNVEQEMKRAAKEERFEEAETWRRKLFALRHIRDVAVLTQDTNRHEMGTRTDTNRINVFGRIEGYDISNISGTSAVGSMVVFQGGEPAKGEYKRFKIKGVRGINDVAMMREVLTRRFVHARPPLNLPLAKGEKEGVGWPKPDLIVIDGGWGQVNAAQEVVDDIRRQGLRSLRRPCLPNIPIIGIAKGFKRKQDRPIFDKDNPELARIVENYKDLLLRVRDEAHRFAVAYHRKVRKRAFSTR